MRRLDFASNTPRASGLKRSLTAALLAGVSLFGVASGGGCKSSSISLSVDLRTDYVPGREFAHVTTEVVAGGDDRQADQPIADSDGGFTDGARIADFGDVPAGDVLVRVKVLSKEGTLLVERLSRLEVKNDYALTVVVTRNCEGVVCPAPAGDPSKTTCDRGQCVAPECTPLTPDACNPPECKVDADCHSDTACVDAHCSAGTCLFVPVDAKCASTQTCDATQGCTPPLSTCKVTETTETTCDDGTDNDCDGKTDCEDSDCAGKTCEDGNRCTTGETCQGTTCVGGSALSCDDKNPCTDDSCDPVSGCMHVNNAASCDDGDACTSGDTCKDGTCVAGTTPTSCDDMNPCTDDVCDPKAGCGHVNNTGPCNDGTFCNGADTCAGGACTGHAGNPCTAPAVCNEGSKACVGCLVDADCGPVTYGAWGACGGFSGTCGESGTQSRTVTTPKCGSGGVCTYVTSSQSQACSRNTNGVVCGTTTYSAWGSCGGFSSACDKSGTQTRTQTTYACSGGACAGSNTTQSQSCTRTVNNGTSCGSGKYCCSGACYAINDPNHCSSCGIKCASGNCAGVGSGHYACTCASNSECQSDGFGSGATCWAPTGGTMYCNCQCTTANCCAGGANCYKPSGQNYCSY